MNRQFIKLTEWGRLELLRAKITLDLDNSDVYC